MAARTCFLLGELQELAARKRFFAAIFALRIERFAQELDVRDAGDFDQVLEAEEQTCSRALVRFHVEQFLPAKLYRAAGHFIAGPAAEYVARHGEITDVLLTGGDPLVLPTPRLAAAVLRRDPWLPVEDETRLEDPAARRRFLTRVYAGAEVRAARSLVPGIVKKRK